MIVQRYSVPECYAMARFHLREARLSLANAVAARSRAVRSDARLAAVEALVWASAWRDRARRSRSVVSSDTFR